MRWVTFAHAFGQNFSLPLPVWMFLFGGVAAVVLSFAVVTIFSGSDVKSQETDDRKAFVVPGLSRWRGVTKAVGLLLFLLTVFAGLLGNQVTGQNFNITFFWVDFIVGFTYLTAIFGNIWKVLNPFRTIVELVARLTRRRFPEHRPYPKWLGYYPALVIYVMLICLELLFRDSATLPITLSGLLVYYTFVSLMGCAYFGVNVWFKYIDFFSVFFGLVSKLSPFEYRRGHLFVRKALTALLEVRPQNMSLVLFIIFMIASTSFDGFNETRPYAAVCKFLFHSEPNAFSGVVVLTAATSLLFGLYVVAVAMIRRVVATELSVRQLCYAFAPTLVPIAVGYNVAHYLSYLIINSQRSLQQISDPFDAHWNLFGTAHLAQNPASLNPYATWYLQLGAIIAGHIVAVFLAHKVAVRLFKKRSYVAMSQLPLVTLMVLYTFMSLWIIAQPVYVAIERSRVQQEVMHSLGPEIRPIVPMPPL